MNNLVHHGKLRNMASVYLIKDNKILLLLRKGNSIVSNLWIGSAGGHFECSELNDAKACVLRELYEELNISDSQLENLSLRYITLRYTDEEIRKNYYFFADLSKDVQNALESNEGITRWFDLKELSELPMPFTARYMIDHYIDIGQYDTFLYGGLADRESVTFIKL